MVSKHRYKYCFDIGNIAETKFKELVESFGLECTASTKQENMHQKIDFFVKGKGIDVKGNKHLDNIWLEIVNVKGNNGWLYGKSDYIAIEIIELNAFCIFPRYELAEYTNQFKQITTDKNDYYKLYTRQGRNDVIIKVKYEDIKHLEKFKINYER
jgi:hypothetical protein